MHYLLSSIALVILIPGCSTVEQAPADNPPNIIMILGDDHGYDYFGFMGSKDVLTPNLDQLAANGILFPQGHVTASVCPPSLRSLLTGLYPLQYDFLVSNMSSDSVMNLDEVMFDTAITELKQAYPITNFNTLPDRLSEAGYVSFEGGKYWEGTYDLAGFTDGMTKSSGNEEIEQHGAIYAMAGGDGLTLGRESNNAVYDFITAYGHQPFYIWYAPMLPHTPHDPPAAFIDMYADKGLTDATQKYYANITRFDTRVGELISYLDSTGLRENTLIFYIADNGYEQNPEDEFHPMGQRRGKGSLHEMGFRTPLIFNWPGRIPAGQVNQGFVNSVDIFPTVLDFAGTTIPDGIPGKSIKQNILKNTPTLRDTLYGSMHQLRVGPTNPASGSNPFANDMMSYYLTNDQWHFISYEDRDSISLYDRIQDPLELRDRSADYPELVAQFLRQIEQWKLTQLVSSE